MTKKIFILFSIILCTFFITTYSFAAMNQIQNVANDVKGGVQNVENGAENIMKDTAGAIKEGTQDVQNAGQNMTNDMMNNSDGSETTTDNADNSYTATRTATGFFDGSNTMWTWIILAVIAAAIIGLVWYYVAQNNNSHQD